ASCSATTSGRPLVVAEHDAVPDEDAVADRHAVADEGVALDLAARADDGAALDLDEGPDPRPVADAAAVQVGERVDDDAGAEHHVVDQPMRRVVGRMVAHSGTVEKAAGRCRQALHRGVRIPKAAKVE